MALMIGGAPRGLKAFFLPITFLIIVLLLIATQYHTGKGGRTFLEDLEKQLPAIINSEHDDAARPNRRPTNTFPPPIYKPTPTWEAPPATDPFPLLALSDATPPPIPPYNIPRPGLHREYGLSYMPPLFIGFTRQWPMLLQAVVGYITAGWPPESIIVVENTGVQNSNAAGQLTIQNPFYLNHTTLQRLGVKVLQTPVLLTFSQMQNFFLATAHARSWPHYFYSHQDTLVFSFEDGEDTIKRPGDRDWFFYDHEDEVATMRPASAGEPGYRTIYENCLRELNMTLDREDRWAFRWFQYDHLTLVNREALDAVGGWDSLMPYYGSDCDMNARLAMDGWSMRHRRVGIINDISTVLEDLAVLYRVEGLTPRFVDPNPIPDEEKDPSKEETEGEPKEEATTPDAASPEDVEHPPEPVKEDDEKEKGDAARKREEGNVSMAIAKLVSYFRELVKVGDDMGNYKYRDSDKARNSWQASQHGGEGESYYYNPEGFSQAFWILAEAGREVYRQKWGHRDCDLVEGTALNLDDAWRVEKDWQD